MAAKAARLRACCRVALRIRWSFSWRLLFVRRVSPHAPGSLSPFPLPLSPLGPLTPFLREYRARVTLVSKPSGCVSGEEMETKGKEEGGGRGDGGSRGSKVNRRVFLEEEGEGD